MKNEQRAESDSNGSGKMQKNPWGSLSQNWGVNDAVENDFRARQVPISHDPPRIPLALSSRIKERLGKQVPEKKRPESPPPQSFDSASESDSEEDWCKRSKVLRMRMHADDEEEKIQKRILKKVRTSRRILYCEKIVPFNVVGKSQFYSHC